MAIREILKSNQPILREKAREVTVFDQRLSTTIDDMIETMFYADGVGLAAPQIGILKRMCVVSPDGEQVFELINPVIEKSEGIQTCVEGCLSLPGVRGKVVRPMTLEVRAQNRHGESQTYHVDGILANIFCHEIDHLDGILFTDKITGGLEND